MKLIDFRKDLDTFKNELQEIFGENFSQITEFPLPLFPALFYFKQRFKYGEEKEYTVTHTHRITNIDPSRYPFRGAIGLEKDSFSSCSFVLYGGKFEKSEEDQLMWVKEVFRLRGGIFDKNMPALNGEEKLNINAQFDFSLLLDTKKELQFIANMFSEIADLYDLMNSKIESVKL